MAATVNCLLEMWMARIVLTGLRRRVCIGCVIHTVWYRITIEDFEYLQLKGFAPDKKETDYLALKGGSANDAEFAKSQSKHASLNRKFRVALAIGWWSRIKATPQNPPQRIQHQKLEAICFELWIKVRISNERRLPFACFFFNFITTRYSEGVKTFGVSKKKLVECNAQRNFFGPKSNELCYQKQVKAIGSNCFELWGNRYYQIGSVLLERVLFRCSLQKMVRLRQTYVPTYSQTYGPRTDP